MLPVPRSPDGRTIRQNHEILAGCGSTTSIMPVTNQIENLIGRVRQLCKNVRRWRDVRMVKRWTVSAMIEAKKGMRRLRGYRSLPILEAALHRHQQDVLAEIDQKAKAAQPRRRSPYFNIDRDRAAALPSRPTAAARNPR